MAWLIGPSSQNYNGWLRDQDSCYRNHRSLARKNEILSGLRLLDRT